MGIENFPSVRLLNIIPPKIGGQLYVTPVPEFGKFLTSTYTSSLNLACGIIVKQGELMLTIDGAYGEGGGQILRTTLTLAALLKRPVRLKNIRAGRNDPGLAAQHLTAVRAAAAICQADLSGDRLGSTQLTFTPQSLPLPGVYQFDVT